MFSESINPILLNGKLLPVELGNHLNSSLCPNSLIEALFRVGFFFFSSYPRKQLLPSTDKITVFKTSKNKPSASYFP